MIRSRRFAAAAGLVAVGAFLLLAGGGPRALAKGKKDAGPRWQKSWAAAVAEARSRNALIFATFHKDN